MALSIRDAYGKALEKYGNNPDVVVLDADVSASTKSELFGKKYPERFFNVGIAEANMNAMACGFASCGKIPFTNTFATFNTSNGLLSLRALASYNHLNVKVAGAYAGLSDSYDGPTHHAIDDIAIMNALPNFTVVVASDEYIVDFLVKSAIEKNGPFYLRLSREAVPAIYDENSKFEIGKANTIKEGHDVCIIACGVMVNNAKKAAQALEKDGIHAGVVDMFTIKPLDQAAIIEISKKYKAIVVAEEHNIHGGLCTCVASALVANRIAIPTAFVGIQDCHAESGAYAQLLEKYELDETRIATACRSVLQP